MSFAWIGVKYEVEEVSGDFAAGLFWQMWLVYNRLRRGERLSMGDA